MRVSLRLCTFSITKMMSAQAIQVRRDRRVRIRLVPADAVRAPG